MIKVEISYHAPDTDKWEFEFPCPVCKLETPITFGQIRREEYFICRGCLRTIKAIDRMGGIQQLKDIMNNIFG